MKKHWLLSILLSCCVLWSCGDDDDPENIIGGNNLPTCSISNPSEGQEFSSDESITVTVVAEDKDGTITEVQLYIDNIGHSAKSSFPYNFVINAGELTPGSHTLKAVAKDDSGAQGDASITITVKEPTTESPDFVTFSDNKIPNTWQTTLWYVDNSLGYDDIYSLRATIDNIAVVTKKTCNSEINYIEFYLKGYRGTVTFFIDGDKKKTISLTNDWVLYGFSLEEGLHTFKWEFATNGYSNAEVNLDAIRFKKTTYLAVGMEYQGGIIAYLDDSGQHGLIAAKEDQSEGIQWYNGTSISISTSSAIGSGNDNTENIVRLQGDGSYAAKICYDLVIDEYSDWFLPSSGELNLLYQNRHLIGGFDLTAAYWSSSELSSNYAWYQGFSSGYQSNYIKSNTCRVRAVRAF